MQRFPQDSESLIDFREKRKTEKLSKKEDAQLAAAQEFAEKKAAEANDPNLSINAVISGTSGAKSPF